jgi:hypothetical protein
MVKPNRSKGLWKRCARRSRNISDHWRLRAREREEEEARGERRSIEEIDARSTLETPPRVIPDSILISVVDLLPVVANEAVTKRQ